MLRHFAPPPPPDGEEDAPGAATPIEGLWTVPLSSEEAPQLVLQAKGLYAILGKVQDQPNHLLVVQKNQPAPATPDIQPPCSFRIMVADVSTKQLFPPQNPLSRCVSEVDLLELAVPDRLRGNQSLANSGKEAAPPRFLRIAVVPPGAEPTFARFGPGLLPPTGNEDDEENNDGFGRADPIWLSDTQVLYVKGPGAG